MARPDFPKSVMEFQRRFATDEACLEYLIESRWPEGFACPRCCQKEHYVTEDRETALVESAMKLFSVETNDLYAVLGMQLLGCAKPTRAAGIVTFFSAVHQANMAVNFIEIMRPDLIERGELFEVVHEELKRDGVRYLAAMSGELRKTLCNEEILKFSDQLTPSNLHVIIMVVGAALKISTQFDSICATVAVLLLKNGLRDFCA